MIETHPFGIFAPPNAKYLVLGSFTAIKRDDDNTYDWFYGSKRNQFWSIIEEVYGIKLPDKKAKQKLFTKLSIAIADIIYQCERRDGNSLDANLINFVYNTPALKKLLKRNSIQKIFFSSRFVEKEFKKHLKEIIQEFPDIEFITLPSPSPRYAAMSKKEKIKRFTQIFPKLNKQVKDVEKHYCESPSSFPLEKFYQKGNGKGKHILIVGESPAENGWRKSGKAFYNPKGRILPTGKRLNQSLSQFDLSVENCGFTELAKCFVGKNRKILGQCSLGCWPIFLKQLESVNYKLIIILGVKTLEIFNELGKTKLTTGKLSRGVKINGKEYTVLGIYHPSPVNPHGQRENQVIFESVKKELLALG